MKGRDRARVDRVGGLFDPFWHDRRCCGEERGQKRTESSIGIALLQPGGAEVGMSMRS